MLLTKTGDVLFSVDVLNDVRDELFGFTEIKSKVVEVGMEFELTDSPCTVRLPNYILVHGKTNTYRLILGVDDGQARYTLEPAKNIIHPDQVKEFDEITLEMWNQFTEDNGQSVSFFNEESMIDYLLTGGCDEFSEKPQLFLVGNDTHGYRSPYALNRGYDVSDTESVVMFYPKQLEMIRQRAMIPEYEDEAGLRDVPPLQQVDLAYVQRRIAEAKA